MQYNPDQIERYMKLAVKDIEGILWDRKTPLSKYDLHSGVQALRLALNVFIAQKKRCDVNEVRNFCDEHEINDLLETLAEPQLKTILKEIAFDLRGFHDGPTYLFSDGSETVSAVKGKKYFGLIKSVVRKIENEL